VVVLDEVGLAEDSPSLPLKALHPLLEDGTSGADTDAQVNKHCANTEVGTPVLHMHNNLMFFNYHTALQQTDREHRVAFVGISNWALDPAKMNRGVMITRGSPNEDELKESAR